MNNRKEFNRKNDPKHTVETAGFGNQFRKSIKEEYNKDEDLDDSEE
jgi:potassium voltage-gated channel Eag-related subfamily H protein 7